MTNSEPSTTPGLEQLTLDVTALRAQVRRLQRYAFRDLINAEPGDLEYILATNPDLADGLRRVLTAAPSASTDPLTPVRSRVAEFLRQFAMTDQSTSDVIATIMMDPRAPKAQLLASDLNALLDAS